MVDLTSSSIEISASLVRERAIEKLTWLDANIAKKKELWFSKARDIRRGSGFLWLKERALTPEEIDTLYTASTYTFDGSPKWNIESRWDNVKRKLQLFVDASKTTGTEDDLFESNFYLSLSDYEFLFAE